MILDDNINISSEIKFQLSTCMDIILNLFEHLTNPINLSGHYLGALFQQAISAWLCVYLKKRNTTTIVVIVKRTINAIIHCIETLVQNGQVDRITILHETSERIHRDIVLIALESIPECNRILNLI